MISVAVEDGDLKELRPTSWDVGETKDCETPKGAPQSFMVCGRIARELWAEAETYKSGDAAEADSPARHVMWAEHQMQYLDSKTFAAQFKGSGPSWHCKKTIDGLYCTSTQHP